MQKEHMPLPRKCSKCVTAPFFLQYIFFVGGRDSVADQFLGTSS